MDEELLGALRAYMKLYPRDPDGQLAVMSYLYRNNKLAKLSIYAKSVKKQYTTLPEKLENYVDFWISKGGIS